MDGKQTVKYVAFYQLLAGIATVVGFGLIGAGIWLGFGEAFAILFEEAPQNFDDAVNAASPGLFAIMSVLGVLIWQVGKTFALVVTIGKVAAASGGDGAAGPATVPDAVTERISSLEDDVQTHEKRLSKASTDSPAATASAGGSGSTSGSSGSGSRRSRRRSAATGDDASSGESSAGAESSSRASSSSGRSSSDRSSSERSSSERSSSDGSNRRSNRRAGSSDGSGEDGR